MTLLACASLKRPGLRLSGYVHTNVSIDPALPASSMPIRDKLEHLVKRGEKRLTAAATGKTDVQFQVMPFTIEDDTVLDIGRATAMTGVLREGRFPLAMVEVTVKTESPGEFREAHGDVWARVREGQTKHSTAQLLVTDASVLTDRTGEPGEGLMLLGAKANRLRALSPLSLDTLTHVVQQLIQKPHRFDWTV